MIYWGYDPADKGKPSIHILDCNSRRSEDITVSDIIPSHPTLPHQL